MAASMHVNSKLLFAPSVTLMSPNSSVLTCSAKLTKNLPLLLLLMNFAKLCNIVCMRKTHEMRLWRSFSFLIRIKPARFLLKIWRRWVKRSVRRFQIKSCMIWFTKQIRTEMDRLRLKSFSESCVRNAQCFCLLERLMWLKVKLQICVPAAHWPLKNYCVLRTHTDWATTFQMSILNDF